MMTKISRRSALGVMGAVTAGAAFRVTGAFARDENVIRFGGSLGMSGRYAETGLNIRHGYETAVRFLNEELGGVEIGGRKYTFELGIVDDASDPARAVALIQRQVDEGVDFFLGSYGSNVVLPCAGITEAAGKVMVQVGASSDQIFTQGYENIFGFFPRASRAWATSIEFFKSLDPKPKTISVISTNDGFSKLNAEAVIAGSEEAGIEVLDHLELPAQVSDASSALATIRSRTPEILVTTTVDQNSLVIIRQMISTGTDVGLLYQFLGPQLPSYRESLGAKATGVIMQLPWDSALNFDDPFFGDTRSYVKYYNKLNKRPLSYHTVGASACISTYVAAMRQAGGIDPQQVRDALDAIDISTAFGRVKFSPDGDGDPIAMGAKLGQVQDGRIEIVYPEDVRTAKLIYPMKPWAEKA